VTKVLVRLLEPVLNRLLNAGLTQALARQAVDPLTVNPLIDYLNPLID
jgi:hypothetical protein